MTDNPPDEPQTEPSANPWAKLLAVQEVDTVIQQLDHRASQLPERAKRDEIDVELSRVRGAIEGAEAEKHELVRAQKRIEDEIATVEDKISREESKMSGSSDPGLLQDLDREITGLKSRISALEDDELELMEQVEPIDARLEQFSAEQQALDTEAQRANAALAEAEASISEERKQALAKREDLTSGIDPDAIARYDTARQRMGGTAVAALVRGMCGACHMKLSAVEYDRVQHLPDDAEVTCEDCGRFLVRV